MALERTLSIVKPDGVSGNLIGEVYRRFEKAGLSIVAARMLHLSQREAEGFYAVHRERPFFKDLVRYMTSGPVIVQVLEGDGAIARNRELMGATDPKKAAPGTIRADLAKSIDQNVLHAPTPPHTPTPNIPYFFRATPPAPPPWRRRPPVDPCHATPQPARAATPGSGGVRGRPRRQAVPRPAADELDLQARCQLVRRYDRPCQTAARAARGE